MQRSDLLLCRHLSEVGLPVTVIAREPVPPWVHSLPHLRAVVDPAAAVDPPVASAQPGIVVVVDEVPRQDTWAAWRTTGVRIVRRHGPGWRLEAGLPGLPPRRLRDWLVRHVPAVAGWLGMRRLQPPFRHDGGHCWWVSLRRLRRSPAGDRRVPMVFEDGRPLAYPDTMHDDIRQLGGGRYSVWEDGLYFSASDGTDPAANGRRYEVRLVTPGDAGELTAPSDDEAAFAARFAALAASRPAAAPSGRRVLIVISSLGPGGAERQFVYLARGLAAHGWQVGILSLDGFDGVAGHYVSLLRDTGVELRDGSRVHPEFAPVGGAAAELLCRVPELFAAEVWRIASHVGVFAPDVLHCALDKPNVLGGIAGTCLAVPRIVLSLRNVNPSHFPRLDLPWFRRWYQGLAEVPGLVFSANSRAGGADYAAWLGLPKERVHIVHNGLDGSAVKVPSAADTAALRRRFGLQPADPVVVGVFRIAEEKRPLLWLAVVAELRCQFPRLQALHVGEGPDAAAMDARIGALGLDGVVHRLGRQDDPSLAVRAADLLLLVSSFEGVPNVVLETQWLERPVVCTAAGGSAEAVQHGVTGFVVDEPEPKALAAACATMLADREMCRRMGQAGRQFVTETFAVEQMVTGSLALYR